jgi:hypothetical protein
MPVTVTQIEHFDIFNIKKCHLSTSDLNSRSLVQQLMVHQCTQEQITDAQPFHPSLSQLGNRSWIKQRGFGDLNLKWA